MIKYFVKKIFNAPRTKSAEGKEYAEYTEKKLNIGEKIYE
jgi:hypothetical protein